MRANACTISIVLAVSILSFTRWGSAADAPPDLAGQILAMTGARTKIVWVHSLGRNKGWDGVEPTYELKAFDTDEGKARVVLPGPASYANPCISPDGEKILYTDGLTNTIFVINWDGSGKKELAKGYVLCTWRKPDDRSQWLYFTRDGYMTGPVVRCRIDDPSVSEIVWSKDQAAHTLSISADGTHAGSEFPWPFAGVAVFPNVSWRQYGNGCNGCIAPDNSYRFFHMGEEIGHDGVIFYDDGGANRRAIRFRQGFDSWVPRWSTDVRFLTTNMPIGGPDADIYIGKFDSAFTKVESWIRISYDPGQDTKAFAWIDPGLGQYEGEVPFDVAVSSVPTRGSEWAFDYGDGTVDASRTHRYVKAGTYAISARHGDTTLKGYVNARERKPPSVREALLLDATHVQLTFDERVRLKDAAASTKSGAAAKSIAPDGEGLSLMIEFEKPLPRRDAIRLSGVLDLAQEPNAVAGEIRVERPPWPIDRAGLVFLWQDAKSPSFQYSSTARAFNRTSLKSVWMARFNQDGAMLLAGGAFLAPDAASGVAAECSRTGQFSLEALVVPHNIHQGHPEDPRRIIGCNREGGIGDVNLALCQEGANLVAFIRSRPADSKDQNGAVRRVELCTLADRSPNHVVLTWAAGRLACYLNGKLVKESGEVAGVLYWGKGRFEDGLHMGGRGDVRFPWRGRLEGIAIFSRELSAEEAAGDFAAYSKITSARKPPPRIELQAKVSALSDIPKPIEVAPYRDALVVNEYEVVKVLRGKYKGPRMRVAQWGLIDTRPTALAQAKAGDVVNIAVEPFAAHPELEAEALRDSLPEDLSLALYADVTIEPSGEPRLASITLHPGELWLPPGASQRFEASLLDQYGNPIRVPLAWSVTPGGQIDLGTAYGAGHWFEEARQPGEGHVDASGLFAATAKAGTVTVFAAAANDPSVKGAAIVAVGNWPPINPAGRAPMRFGLDNGDGNAYVGDIDRIRIWKRALPQAELAEHAAGRGLETTDGLVGDWTFDEPKDGAYPNAAGNGLAAKTCDQVEHVVENGSAFARFSGRGYLEVAPDPRLDISKACTIEAWIRPKKEGCIVSKQIVWMWGFLMCAQGDGLSLDALRTTTGGMSVQHQIPKDTWTHVAGVFDACGRWQLHAGGKLLKEQGPHPLLIRE